MSTSIESLEDFEDRSSFPQVAVPTILEDAYFAILSQVIGERADREGLVETPGRAARAWQELTSGYGVNVAALLKTFSSDGYDEMVHIGDIPFSSLCEHHLLPFTGKAHVVYVPNARIVGLSKIPRLVDVFARRLQVQERMTTEIADALDENLKPQGVMVIVEATHMCATLRGVRKPGVVMRTSAIRGVFKNPTPRAEALALVGLK